MLRRIIGEDIELVTLPATDLGLVKVHPGQIEQVLVNLAVNARDAMPDGGKLSIETADVTLDRHYAERQPGVIAGEYVSLAVIDNGTGITDEAKGHLFEPFFTTKEPGKGTGLGLSTCYGIIKQNGGHISVYSELGHGTTFKIYLPRHDEIGHSPASRPASGDLPRGMETVLVVEDEPSVRAVAVLALRERGYTVLEAGNGSEALQVIQEHAQMIHLMLTDVVMPLMGGRDLADQLRPSHPETSVLYTSGYTDHAIVHHNVLDPGTEFIQKPFSPAQLARKVRELLDMASHSQMAAR